MRLHLLKRLRRLPSPLARRAAVLGMVSLLATGTLVGAGPSAASAATPYCILGLVYQDAFVPGSIDLEPDCISAQGAVNNAVGNLQRSLRQCNLFENIAVDNVFGPQTRAALVRLQQRLGIAADGVYGPQTRRAMQHVKVGGGCKRTT
jgi:peptidoglycan hydrolase-like protein with peptidoglycan-binding domain